MPAITINGPQACERPCVECDPGHHWLPESIAPDEAEDYGVDDRVLTYEREHGTDHAIAHYRCKHCPAWISDDDFDVLLFGEDAE